MSIMSGSADALSRKQRKAISSLIGGAPAHTAAAVAGVSPRTLRRWRSRRCFAEALKCEQDEMFASALGDVRAAAVDASKALRDVASDSMLPPSARVAAAKCLLDMAFRSRELEDLERRVVELELCVRQRAMTDDLCEV